LAGLCISPPSPSAYRELSAKVADGRTTDSGALDAALLVEGELLHDVDVLWGTFCTLCSLCSVSFALSLSAVTSVCPSSAYVTLSLLNHVCVCVCRRMCVRACVHEYVCVYKRICFICTAKTKQKHHKRKEENSQKYVASSGYNASRLLLEARAGVRTRIIEQAQISFSKIARHTSETSQCR